MAQLNTASTPVVLESLKGKFVVIRNEGTKALTPAYKVSKVGKKFASVTHPTLPVEITLELSQIVLVLDNEGQYAAAVGLLNDAVAARAAAVRDIDSNLLAEIAALTPPAPEPVAAE